MYSMTHLCSFVSFNAVDGLEGGLCVWGGGMRHTVIAHTHTQSQKAVCVLRLLLWTVLTAEINEDIMAAIQQS